MARPTFTTILSHITYFLTVAIHTILAERNVYPFSSFITARAYNLPVKQSRHPGVCSWIQSAVAAIRAELVKGSVARAVLAIAHPETYQILERYVFDLERLPHVPRREMETPLVWGEEETGTSDPPPEESKDPRRPGGSQVHELADLTEQLRAALASISVCRRRLGAIPEGCTFTVAIELKDEADAPIDHPEEWIPVQPELQRMKYGQDEQFLSGSETSAETSQESKAQDQNQPKESARGSALGGQRTIPMRSVNAGGVALELWVEEGKAKSDTPNVRNSQSIPSSGST